VGRGPHGSRPAERAAAFVYCIGRWRAMGSQMRQKNSFSVEFFYITGFNCFLFSFWGKFQIVFSIQIIPTKNLFREFKSYKNIYEKFKVDEFLIHNFCCK
jgi:hypothetical protein